jgi:hypothetical protein
MNMKALKGEEMTGTDAEACAYLMTVSLTQPIDHDWTQIYLYIATKTCERARTRDSGITMPADIRVDSLDDSQMRDLNRLKDWIYQTRMKHRQVRGRAARREERKEAAAAREAEQPALFDF